MDDIARKGTKVDPALHALLEWQALQHAPNPIWHTRAQINVGDPLTQEDVNWMAAYQRWYFGLRIKSMRGLPDITPIQRVAELERELQQYKDLLDHGTVLDFLRAATEHQEDI